MARLIDTRSVTAVVNAHDMASRVTLEWELATNPDLGFWRPPYAPGEHGARFVAEYARLARLDGAGQDRGGAPSPNWLKWRRTRG